MSHPGKNGRANLTLNYFVFLVPSVVKPFSLRHIKTNRRSRRHALSGNGDCRRIIPGFSAALLSLPPLTRRTLPNVKPPLISAMFASAKGFPTKLGIT